MSSLERLYGIMKELDEVVDAMERKKKETEQEMETLVSTIKSKISDELNTKITQLINEYRSSIDSKTSEEVKKYLDENLTKMERLKNRKQSITESTVQQVMSLLGFT